MSPRAWLHRADSHGAHFDQFIAKLKLPEDIKLRPYQVQYIMDSINSERGLYISPTASGKSLIVYALLRYYAKPGNKTLVLVDTINLLNQMSSDFRDYGFDSEAHIHNIQSGAKKESPKPIFVSTWQSAGSQKPDWFAQFQAIIVDEAHRAKAVTVKKILENMPDCKYRHGYTGSLDESLTNKLVLEGLFGGPTKKFVSTKELQDQGYLSNMIIKVCQIGYTEAERKAAKNFTYQDELKFLFAHVKRNNFIRKLATSRKGNTLILFLRSRGSWRSVIRSHK
jgi:superfamily II DNA or RNA helicase